MVVFGLVFFVAVPQRFAALRIPLAPIPDTSTGTASATRRSMHADSADSLVWAEDEMTLWGDHEVGALPESIPGRSAFLKWHELFRRSGDLVDETEMLESQRSRFLEKNELEEVKWRVQNVSAGSSRTHPFVPAAKKCGVNPGLHLNYSDGRIHYKETKTAPPGKHRKHKKRTYVTTEYDIPMDSTNNSTSFESTFGSLSVFRDKWIYMHGDSTMRQQCQTFVEAVVGTKTDFYEFKECMRNGSSCPSGSKAYTFQTHQAYDWEFHYFGPPWFYHPEKTVSFYFPSLNATLTCDWKFHIFRRYDRWLLKRRFQLEAPDLYIVSPGLHDCFWRYPAGLGGGYHALEADTLMEYLSAFMPDRTKLMWLSAQISTGGNVAGCVKDVNAAARQAAVKHSVTFIDRGNFTGELAQIAHDYPRIREHISRDYMHFEEPFTRIIFRHLLEASRCVLSN